MFGQTDATIVRGILEIESVPEKTIQKILTVLEILLIHSHVHPY
jgi:hypothetical protein